MLEKLASNTLTNNSYKNLILETIKEAHIELEQKVKEIIKEGFMEYYSPKKKTSFKINADFITKSYPFSMKKNADKVKIPTLIIQGDNDEQVNYKDAIKVISTFPNAELKLIQGADHALSVNGDYSQGQNVLRDFFGK